MIDRFLYYFLALLLTALVFLLFINILFRFVFHLPIDWTEEISMLLFTWIVFLGAAVIQKKNGHVRIQILYDRCSPKVRLFLKSIGDVFVLFLLVILIIESEKLVRYQFHTLTTSLMLPYSIFSFSMLISVLLMLAYTVLSFIISIQEMAGKKALDDMARADDKKGS